MWAAQIKMCSFLLFQRYAFLLFKLWNIVRLYRKTLLKFINTFAHGTRIKSNHGNFMRLPFTHCAWFICFERTFRHFCGAFFHLVLRLISHLFGVLFMLIFLLLLWFFGYLFFLTTHWLFQHSNVYTDTFALLHSKSTFSELLCSRIMSLNKTICRKCIESIRKWK